MRKRLLSVLCLCIASLLYLNVHAQKRTITGSVTDSAGAPIPNVSVRIKSARSGVSSKEDGSFQISAGSTDELIFSNVGFATQEIRIGNKSNIMVTLSRNAQALNEVVVTALGIRRSKNSLPYATQQISGDQVNKTLNTNFVDNLSGKVAGLQITSSNTMGGSNNVILRGMKSLTQTNQALFVVDGVPFDNTNPTTTGAAGGYDMGNAVSDINPNDIESISVLKGAAASALYGSRGSNGVILITTKRGSRLNKGLGIMVDFGINAGTPDKSTLPKYQTQYGEGQGSSGASAGNPNPYFFWQPTSFSNGQNVQIVQTPYDQMTGPAYDASTMVYQWDAFSPGNPNYGKATPWMPAAHHNAQDYFVTPITTSTSVFLDGGGDKGTFKMGYTRSTDKGYLPNSNLLKNLLNFGATYSLAKNLTASGQFNFTEEDAIGRYGYGYGGSNGTQYNPMTDFRQFWQTGINLKEQKADYFRTLTNATWNWQTSAYTANAPGNITTPNYHDNPYWVRYENPESDTRDRYFGYASLNWKVAPFLNILGRASRDAWSQLIETRYNVGTWGTPSYSRTNLSYNETNYDFLASFDKNISDNFNLKAILGTNVRQDNYSSIVATTNGGLVVPGFYALSNSVNTPNAPTEVFDTKEVDGIFAGATLSWKDMITLDGSLRRDKSSTLPVAHNSYYYPAISANWVFSKLMPEATWLSYGKLRANYAAVGGDAPYFSLTNTYTAVTPFNGQTIFSAPTTNNNASLVPETNHTYEVGAEMSFLQSRLGLDVTYYHAREINEILPVTVSTGSGYSKFFVNGGTIQNQGVELTLNLQPVKSRDFTWDMAVNWSTNMSKVISLYDNQPSFEIAGYQNSVQLVAETGKSYGIIRGTDYKYLNKNGQIDTLGQGKRLVDANGYPILSGNKLSDIGNINPKWMGGINNSFHYKSFSLSFLIDIRHGGSVYSLDQDYGASAGTTPHTGGYNKNGVGVRAPLSQNGGYLFTGVTADGKANATLVDASDFNAGKFPWSSLFDEAARTFVYDASYVKLREVSFTWSMPARILNGVSFVKGIDLSLTGRNLWIIHKNLPDSDPEQGVPASGSYGANASMGFQSGAYPTFRTFGFNAKVKF
jgi:TonB-linked SusC/RagA family outer membrane protein